jgi:hypothetical protein
VEQRFNQIFGDLLKGLVFTNKYKDRVFVISGGSVNIALDSTIDIENVRTDLDIFLLRKESVQRETVKYLLDFFVEKYGRDKIILCEEPSIKYIWIVGTSYHIQIIGTSYMVPHELVNCFDMTHIRCWYDGRYFWKTLDCEVSIRTKISYAVSIPLKKNRLYKTLKRGYRVVPLIYNRTNNNPDNLLKTYDLNCIVSDEVDRYMYMMNNHNELFPKEIDDKFTIKKNLSFMVNKRQCDIVDLRYCETQFLDMIYEISNRHKIFNDGIEAYTNINAIISTSNNDQKSHNVELLTLSNYKIEDIMINKTTLKLIDRNYHSWKINIGNNIISNIIFEHKTQRKIYGRKIILMLKAKKYGIYLTMMRILDKIKEYYGYDISNVKIAKSFINQPNDIENNYKKYIGDYLICWDYSGRFSKNNSEYGIGQILNTYLSFSIELEENNTIKSIYPELNFDHMYE